jgi:hypothetical protein
MYRKANDVRRIFGIPAYTDGEYIMVPTGEATKMNINNATNVSQLRQIKVSESLQKTKIQQLKGDKKGVESLFRLPEVTEESLLFLCNVLARKLYLPVYLHGNIIVVGDKTAKNLSELKAVIFGGKKEDIPVYKALRDIADKSDTSIMIQDGKACVLDGVAYLAATYQDYISVNPNVQSKVVLMGYLKDGNPVWEKIDQSKYTSAKAEGDKSIRILHTLDKEKVKEVYRTKTVSIGVKAYSYPIAILEDGALAYYVKGG